MFAYNFGPVLFNGKATDLHIQFFLLQELVDGIAHFYEVAFFHSYFSVSTTPLSTKNIFLSMLLKANRSRILSACVSVINTCPKLSSLTNSINFRKRASSN